ncbi:hypothetical protein BJP32_11620 [Brevundimonas sp. ZS04]|nr:hypothetical protein BJP32_11620 [Brevundimonas sp. ZS04]
MPPLPSSEIVFHSTLTAPKSKAVLRTIVCAFREQEGLKNHELPSVPKMDGNSDCYLISERCLWSLSERLSGAIWDHLGRLTTTVSGTVGGLSGVGSAARTSNFERGKE